MGSNYITQTISPQKLCVFMIENTLFRKHTLNCNTHQNITHHTHILKAQHIVIIIYT